MRLLAHILPTSILSLVTEFNVNNRIMNSIICLIIAYILNIIDYIFTAHWVRLCGIGIETNPIGRWMFENNVAWVFKILIVGVIFAVLGYFIHRRPQVSWVVYIPLAVYGLIVIYHIIIAINVLWRF